MYRILSISSEPYLLFARNEALVVAGFSVVSLSTPHSIPQLLAHGNIEAVVLGHSVPSEMRQFIIGIARQIDPCCPVFFVYEYPYTRGEPLADLSIDVTSGSHLLVAELTGGRLNHGTQIRRVA